MTKPRTDPRNKSNSRPRAQSSSQGKTRPGTKSADPSRASGTRSDPETASEALLRAQTHARRAIGEALAALRALLDAASLGVSGRPSQANAALRAISELLDEQSRSFREGEAGVPAPVMGAILDALDQEIGRWEKRASRDADARAVLRTFLGLREILWEFGFRRHGEEPSERSGGARDAAGARSDPRDPADESATAETDGSRSARPRAGDRTPKRRSRVQRVDVQG